MVLADPVRSVPPLFFRHPGKAGRWGRGGGARGREGEGDVGVILTLSNTSAKIPHAFHPFLPRWGQGDAGGGWGRRGWRDADRRGV